MPPKKKTPAQPPTALPAEGKGHKRTPQSAYDPAKGAETYEPEKIVGTRQKNIGGGKFETQFCVKWKGYDAKQNTYEPIEHLAGCEDMIAEYYEEKKQKDAEMEASSAGVERVFSAAGKMHDDLRKSAKDDTLEHSLFAAFNTD